MTDRRYDDDESREIFDAASRAGGTSEPGTGLTVGSGFTLAELQEIGVEAGMDPGRIAEAARALDLRPAAAPPARRLLGVPVGVARTVELPATFDEDDWNRLVVDLRQTFDARGKIRVEGAFRAWSNGNLQALVEPTDEGFQLRLRTLKRSATQSAALAGAGLVFAVFLTMALLAKGELDAKWIAPAFIALLSAGNFAAQMIQLPGWAHTRERQMEEVAARALLRAGAKAEDDDGEEER